MSGKRMGDSECTGAEIREWLTYMCDKRARVFQKRVLKVLQKQSTGMLMSVRVLVG